MSIDNKIKSLSYPTGLETIPYASFLSIQRYSYSEALEKIAKNQNDALGAISGSDNIIVKGAIALAGKSLESFTDSGENARLSNNNIFNKQFKGAAFVPGENGAPGSIEGGKDNRVVTIPGTTKRVKLGELKKDKAFLRSLRLKGLEATTCNLPMPNEYQYSYGADWNNEFKLGTLSLIAENGGAALRNMLVGGALGATPQVLTNSLNNNKNIKNVKKNDKNNAVSGLASGIANGAKRGLDPFNKNSPLDATNIAGLAGLAPNENAIQMFQKMNMREFEFTFEFAARDKQESQKIESIIEWFKRGMHPMAKSGRGSAVMLQFPDVWIITPKFVPATEKNGQVTLDGKPMQHPMMPKTKLCALVSMQVNTTPMAQMQTMFDGNIPLVQVNLRFKETTALTRNDMEGSSGQTGGNGAVKWQKGEALDNLPIVKF